MSGTYYSLSYLNKKGDRVDEDFQSIEMAAKSFAKTDAQYIPSLIRFSPSAFFAGRESASTLATTSVVGGGYAPEKRLLVDSTSPLHNAYYDALGDIFRDRGIFTEHELKFLSETVNKHPLDTFVERRAWDLAISDSVKGESTYEGAINALKQMVGSERGIVATFSKEYGKQADALGIALTAIEAANLASNKSFSKEVKFEKQHGGLDINNERSEIKLEL